jgi:hypothetical protein
MEELNAHNRELEEVHVAIEVAYASIPRDPHSWKEAIHHPFSEQWRAVVQVEYN